MSIQDFANSFEVRKRENGDEYYICENDDYTGLIRDCHEGRLPNDQDYNDIYNAAESLAHYGEIDEDTIYQVAEDCTETNTYQLMLHLQNPDFREEANEYIRDANTIEDAAMIAHNMKMRRIANMIVEYFA